MVKSLRWEFRMNKRKNVCNQHFISGKDVFPTEIRRSDKIAYIDVFYKHWKLFECYPPDKKVRLCPKVS